MKKIFKDIDVKFLIPIINGSFASSNNFILIFSIASIVP